MPGDPLFRRPDPERATCMAPTPVGWRPARIHAWVRDSLDAEWHAQIEYLGEGRFPHLTAVAGSRVVAAHACLEQCVVWRSRWYSLEEQRRAGLAGRSS